MKKIISLILNTFFKLFKVKKNKIVFEAGRGLIDGNAKAVYDYIAENKIDCFEIVWLVSKGTDCSHVNKKHCFFYKTFKGYYHLATAHYWIRNESLGGLLKKKKGQVYIQLWHGNGAMKNIGYDVTGQKALEPLDYVKEWDYYIAKDELDANHIITGTGYTKKIEILGMAGIDTTLKLSKNETFKKELLKKIGVVDLHKKILLYAPTFRDFDLDKDIIHLPIEKLSELDDYIVLVRLHPLVRKKIDNSIFNNKNFINVCEYPDASDLLTIVDLLITDYSSIFYQFCSMKKPIIFYPYDFKKYLKLRGGFYLDYKKDLPGPICYTEEELFNTIKNIEEIITKYKTKIKKFDEKYNYLSDGKSSERFVNKLIKGDFDK